MTNEKEYGIFEFIAPCLIQRDFENFRFRGVDSSSRPSRTEHRCDGVFRYPPFSVRRQAAAGCRQEPLTTPPSEQVFLPREASQQENPFPPTKWRFGVLWLTLCCVPRETADALDCWISTVWNNNASRRWIVRLRLNTRCDSRQLRDVSTSGPIQLNKVLFLARKERGALLKI